MKFQKLLISALFLSTTFSPVFARANGNEKGDPCTYFERNPQADELEQFRASAACIAYKGSFVMGKLEELEKFSDGSTLAALKKHYVKVAELYPKFEKSCNVEMGPPSPACTWFMERIHNQPDIKIGFFHAVLMLGDAEFLRQWVRTMPIHNVNKVIHVRQINDPAFRFTFAEMAAGLKFTSLETLKVLKEEGLLDLKSKESYPLHRAVKNNRLDRAKYLIELGYDINALDSRDFSAYCKREVFESFPEIKGITPLQLAIIEKHQPMLEFLMTHPKINLKAKNEEGNDAFYTIAKAVGFLWMELPEVQELYASLYESMLTDPRVDVMGCSPLGDSAFHHLVMGYAYDYTPSDQSSALWAMIQSPGFDADKRCTERRNTPRELLWLAVDNVADKVKRKTFKQLARSI